MTGARSNSLHPSPGPSSRGSIARPESPIVARRDHPGEGSPPPVPRFGPLAARGLALFDADVGSDSLTLTLSLSTWIRRAGVALGTARDDLLGLRRALLEVSGLDRTSEPVPMTGHDDRRAVLNLAVYTVGLIGRAAMSSGLGREEIVELALSAA